jgi:hypothetical protein
LNRKIKQSSLESYEIIGLKQNFGFFLKCIRDIRSFNGRQPQNIKNELSQQPLIVAYFFNNRKSQICALRKNHSPVSANDLGCLKTRRSLRVWHYSLLLLMPLNPASFSPLHFMTRKLH